MRGVRRWLVLTHRYLGIPLSLVFVVWFISGIAMIWARSMPGLTPESRLEHLAALDLNAVRIPPSEAAERAGLRLDPESVMLLSVMGRPAYRFGGRAGAATVFADNGERMARLDAEETLLVASRFLGVPREDLRHSGVITEPDQWTIGAVRDLPLHKVAAEDTAGTELYVSPSTAEVAVVTTRASRALAWVSAIPHWFYFRSLRVNGPLWSQVVIWSALIGTVFAVLGLLVGVLQLSQSRHSVIPYRGLLGWHHVAGLAFGVFTLTWVFSGMLSMDPWGWATSGGLGTGGTRRALAGGVMEPSLFPKADPGAWDRLLSGRRAKEVSFLRIQGEPYYDVVLEGGQRLLVRADPLAVREGAFSLQSIMERVHEATEGTPILAEETLTGYDSYYYSSSGEAPLPVVRVKFGDPDRTWFYIDPARGRLVGSLDSRQRIDRWIYHGFHSLDFAFWYSNRSAWTTGVVFLCLGGLATSGLGMFLGFRRVYRGVRSRI